MAFATLGYIDPKNPLYGAVVTDEVQLGKLLNYAKSNLLSSAQYGDWSNWIADVIYYPFTINVFAELYDSITINGVNTGAKGIELGSTKRDYNFEFNKPFVITINNYGFRSLRNTTNTTPGWCRNLIECEVFLPLYGWVQLPPEVSEATYMSIFLALEPRTGFGTYYICIHDIELTSNFGRLDNTSQITQIQLLQAIPVQLGIHIPYGSDGQAQVNRNIIESVSSFSNGIATTIASGITGAVSGSAGGPAGAVAGAVVGAVGGLITNSLKTATDLGLAQQQNATIQGGLTGQYCTFTDPYPNYRFRYPIVNSQALNIGHNYGYYVQAIFDFKTFFSADDTPGSVRYYRGNPDIQGKYKQSSFNIFQANDVVLGSAESPTPLLPQEFDMIRELLSKGVWLPTLDPVE